MLRKMDLQGNPYVGVFCASNDDYVVMPPNLPSRTIGELEEALGVKAIETTVAGSTVVGSLVCMNSNGLVVSHLISDQEARRLKGLRITSLDHRLNAVGNTILANDRGALVHPSYDKHAMAIIADALGVEVERGTIANSKTLGSLAVANNRGVLCHPHASEEEMKLLRDVLKVGAVIATANYGTAQLGACMVANDKGAVVGTPTTPIELGRIEEGLSV